MTDPNAEPEWHTCPDCGELCCCEGGADDCLCECEDYWNDDDWDEDDE